MNFVNAINEHSEHGLGETTYIFLLTVFNRLSFHLHLDRTLGTLMHNEGILSLCMNKIRKEIEHLRISPYSNCKT